MWHQLEIRSAEGVAVARGEVREGHLVGTADFRIDMVNLAGKAVRRKPLGHCVWIEERPIDLLRRDTEHSVKPNGAGGHDYFSFRCSEIAPSLSRTGIHQIDTPDSPSTGRFAGGRPVLGSWSLSINAQ